jgi:hypothetical protein
MLAAARSSSSSGARKRLPPGVATLVIGVATLVAAIAFVLFPLVRIGIGPTRPRIRGELKCCLAGQAWARQAASPGRERMDQRDAI